MAGQDDTKPTDPETAENEGVEEEPEEINGTIAEEYGMLDCKLDELNMALDFLEQKNDDIHQKLKELLQSNKDIRKELEREKTNSVQNN